MNNSQTASDPCLLFMDSPKSLPFDSPNMSGLGKLSLTFLKNQRNHQHMQTFTPTTLHLRTQPICRNTIVVTLYGVLRDLHQSLLCGIELNVQFTLTSFNTLKCISVQQICRGTKVEMLNSLHRVAPRR